LLKPNNSVKVVQMRAIYVDKNIPRVLLTKAIAPIWPGFVWTRFSAARSADLGNPALPGPRWMRVRNTACGLCATDMSLLFMRADPSVAPAALPGLDRFYLGHEVVSVVIEVGPGVTLYKPGDRVIMDSHFYGVDCRTLELDSPCAMCAQGDYHFCLNKSDHKWQGQGGGFGDTYLTHELAVHACPSGLTQDQAVLVEPLSVGVHSVLRHPPKPGEKVLIIGSGIIGLVTLMSVKAA
jgi:threonine dehydrogenase-like Zn-dependent dehydrogenase